MIHLLINNGPQERDFILDRTIAVCEPYFDSIRICQNGGTSPSSMIRGKTIYTNSSFIPFVKALDILKMDIPYGDWLFYLDSDERPQQSLLENLKNLQEMDANTILVPFRHHCINNDGVVFEWLGEKDGFTPARIWRHEKQTESSCYNSAHFGYVNPKTKSIVVPWFINHYKHDFANKLSTLSFGLAMPDSVGFNEGDFEWDMIKNFQDFFRRGMGENCSPSSIYMTYRNKLFWQNVNKKYSALRESKICPHILDGIDWILSNDEFLSHLYRYQPCGRECCRYYVQY